MKEKFRQLLALFWTFFKIGAFTFGGGYAMIPLIQRETVEKKHWITDDDTLEIFAIAAFIFVMFTFVGVNTLMSGLHSYA